MEFRVNSDLGGLQFKEDNGIKYIMGSNLIWEKIGMTNYALIDFFGGIVTNTRTFSIKKNSGISKVTIFVSCSSNGHLQGITLTSTAGEIIVQSEGNRNNCPYKLATLETDLEATVSLTISINATQNFGFCFALFNND